jgi:hypothetical protein
VRLEIRRVSGNIRKDQIVWRKLEGDDDDYMDVCVFDPDGITFVDDAARGKPPYVVFEFKFREDPKITKMLRSIEEEKVDTKIGMRVTRKSTKSGTLALPATGRVEGKFFLCKGSLRLTLIDVPLR